MKRWLAFWAACLWLCLMCVPALAADGYKYSYTYTYDYWEDIRQSPDAYRARLMISGGSLGIPGGLKTPQGLFVRGEDIYICDTGNNRVLQLRLNDAGADVIRVIDSFTGDTEPRTFNSPRDIYVTEEGDLFIADFSNNRIVKLDKDLNWQLSFVKPTDATFDQSMNFLPKKLVADTSGRVYCLAQNVNKGLIKFEANGDFTGFIGASKVRYKWTDYVWKLLSTKEQREQQEAFVPTEYDNVCLDEKGFFYVVTKTFSEAELRRGDAQPVRRLNAIGNNILVENGNSYVIGDLQWAPGNTNITNSGPSKFVDVTVMQDDIYTVLDSTHNRLFTYDQQGNLLWAFGGVGNSDGFFNRPSAMEHMGLELLVLDEAGSLTVMTPTEYGRLVFKAVAQYREGDYEGSAATWKEVLAQNANCDSAYVGMGRAFLQQEKFEDAMQYFKMAHDTINYSEAWRLHRMELVEKNIGWIFAIAVVVLVLPLAVRRIRFLIWEVNQEP